MRTLRSPGNLNAGWAPAFRWKEREKLSRPLAHIDAFRRSPLTRSRWIHTQACPAAPAAFSHPAEL